MTFLIFAVLVVIVMLLSDIHTELKKIRKHQIEGEKNHE